MSGDRQQWAANEWEWVGVDESRWNGWFWVKVYGSEWEWMGVGGSTVQYNHILRISYKHLEDTDNKFLLFYHNGDASTISMSYFRVTEKLNLSNMEK